MKTFDNYALFIGVDDYRAFDASTGKKPGTSDLAGSCNDVRSFYRVCRQMGIGPHNIRVLTSPRLSTDELEGMEEASIREATEQEILDGIDWLSQRIGGENGPPALLTYSGHGDFKEGEGLVICPSDTSGNNLDHAISLAKIQETFAKNKALESLTVVLDCCHSGAARGARKALSLTGRPLPPELAAGLASRGERVLTAAAATGTSYQSRFAGEHHGAFSWALTSAIDQWSARPQGSSVELSVSYGNLLLRAKGLLATLGFSQVPELKGPPLVAPMPFFHRGKGERTEETAVAPDQRRRGGQLQPDVRYTLALSTVPNEWWNISVTGDVSSLGLPTNTELWDLDSSFVTGMAEATVGAQLALTGASLEPPVVQMPAQSYWTQLSEPPAGNLFLGSNDSSQMVGLVSNLVSGTPWSGTMTWYLGTTDAGPPEYAVGLETITLTYGSASEYTEYTWYTMTLPTLSWGTPSLVQSYIYSESATSLASMNGTLYLAYNFGTVIYVQNSTDGKTWSTYSSVAVVADEIAPAIACMSDTLYIACVYSSFSPSLYLYTSTNGSSWSSTVNESVSTTQAPALGVYTPSEGSELLCVAYLDSASSSIMVMVLNSTGTGWSTAAGPGSSATGAPALAGFSNQLFLAQIAGDSQTIQVYRATAVTTSGTTWDPTPLAEIQIDTTAYTATSTAGATSLSSPLSISSVSLGVFNGLLYLSFTDTSQNVWICSSADGVSWSGFAEISSQVVGATSTINAPICVFGSDPSQLVVALTQTYSGTWFSMYTLTAT